MKIHANTRRHLQGSVLMISLITAMILGVMLGSYLILTQSQNLSITRSQGWNTAIALAEAGAEEALAQLNRRAPYFNPADGTNGLDSNGWTSTGNGFLSPRRYLGQDYYYGTITFEGLTPMIYATGYVFMASSYAAAPQTMFAAAGVNVNYGAAFKSRAVRVKTKIDPLFALAMAAKGTINLNGNNIATDSFDSADPNYSTNGLYPSGNLNMTKDNGDVSTLGVIVDSLNIGGADIKGHVQTGPGGTISIGPNGSVGDRAWVEGGNNGIKPGWSKNDFNAYFPDVTLPSVTWFAPPAGATINGVAYDHVFLETNGVRNYKVLDFNKIYIGTNANVNIWLYANDFKMAGNDAVIRIAPVGASLKIYMTGASFSMAGQGVANESGKAENFYYYGLPSNTSVSFNGNAAFTGAIYAPQAAFSLGGGGNNTYDFVGSSVTRTVTMNGKFNFHYDENLARVAAHRGFIPVNWVEK